MQLKKENPKSKMRVALSRRLSELDLPMTIQLKIVKAMGNMTDEQKEAEASRILTAIASCENEADALKALSIE